MKTKSLLLSICEHRVRFCKLQSGEWRIWPKDDSESERIVKALLASGCVRRANSGWTHLNRLGLVQFTYLMSVERSMVRVLSPAIAPRGRFTFPLPHEITL